MTGKIRYIEGRPNETKNEFSNIERRIIMDETFTDNITLLNFQAVIIQVIMPKAVGYTEITFQSKMNVK